MSKFAARLRVSRAATSVRGHLPPLTTNTPHSSRTIKLRIAAQRNRRNQPVTGKARMLAARNAQITVCRSLIAVNAETISLSFLYSSKKCRNNGSLGKPDCRSDLGIIFPYHSSLFPLLFGFIWLTHGRTKAANRLAQAFAQVAQLAGAEDQQGDGQDKKEFRYADLALHGSPLLCSLS